MPRRLPPLFAVCLLGAIGAPEPDAATRRWWSHIRVLAADEMEGRDTGSDGYRKAAAYVAARFEAAGLAPAGERGYYQTVPMHAVRLVPEQSTVELVGRSGQVLRLYRGGTRPAGFAVLRRTHHGAQGADRR